jgi:hypothetical protein
LLFLVNYCKLQSSKQTADDPNDSNFPGPKQAKIPDSNTVMLLDFGSPKEADNLGRVKMTTKNKSNASNSALSNRISIWNSLKERGVPVEDTTAKHAGKASLHFSAKPPTNSDSKKLSSR